MTSSVAASGRQSFRQLTLFLVVYGAVLLALLPKLSLWLDEIVDMMGSQGSLVEAIRWARGNPGGVPFGYIAHWASLQIFGVSALAARLPSAIASLVGCAGIYLLAKSWRLKYPLFPCVAFAVIPLQFRYALEARSYAIALSMSVWTIVLFQSLVAKPAAWKFAAYGFVAICGMYTQPYSAFILAAQAAWVLFSPQVNRPRVIRGFFATLAVVLLAFAAWYIYASGWSHPLTGVEGSEAIGWKSFNLIAHELTGMGYPGTILMFLGIAAGVHYSRPNRLWLWLLYLTASILGALFVDWAFGYFLAIRQMIFALTPLVILFCWGVESLAESRKKLALGLAGVFFAGAVYADIQMFLRPRENWQAAATQLKAEVAQGACIIFEPADFEAYYTFFSQELSSSKCPPDGLQNYRRVAIAVSPRHYSTDLGHQEIELSNLGMSRQRNLGSVLPDVEVFTKTPVY